MCGINGFSFPDQYIIQNMNNSIKHRGPDDEDIFVNNSISLGQVRLSIIDLTEIGRQPMFYEHQSKKNAIVFNGEIYNYLEIKAHLIGKGYHFATQTDTEVILAAYLEEGIECVNKFNGMWSFCIYDFNKDILFCSRDRFGVKPFYYYHKNNIFIFSSEIKAILKHEKFKINNINNINQEAIRLYFALGYIPSPYSIFNDLYKLEAGHNIIFDLKTKEIAKKWRYYNLPQFAPVYNKQKLIEETRFLLHDAVRLRMRSDVPVGAFLSGGLDSGTIVSEIRNLIDLSDFHTFSIGFDKKRFDETPYINIAKEYFRTKHHHYYFKEKDFQNLFDTYSFVYDEPFSDWSGFPTYKVNEIAKEHVTVSLSGDGGDEIFGGYDKYITGHRLEFIRNLPLFIRKLGANIPIKKETHNTSSLYLLREAFKVSTYKKEELYERVFKTDKFAPQIYKQLVTERFRYALDKGDHDLTDSVLVDNSKNASCIIYKMRLLLFDKWMEKWITS